MKLLSPKETSTISWTKQLHVIIKRRKLLVILIITIFLFLLVLYNIGNFLFLHQITNQLERELDLRLNSITRLAATMVENELIESIKDNETMIRNRLQNIRTQHQLEGLFIIDRNLNTLLDSYRDFELNIKRTYLSEDSSWIERAWDGLPNPGPLHIVEDQKFKSAYAPIRDYYGDEIIGVLVAEANVDFFDLLESYRSTFLATALISAGIFILFTTFLLYALRLLIKTQENLRKTERFAMMGHMSAVLAHEIRNPLGIIRGTADILKSRYESKKDPDPMFQYIPDEVNRLNKLVNNFLVLSKDSEINLSKQDLNQLIEDALEKIKLDMDDHSIRFERIKSELQPFYFDKDGIQQVIINFIQNSIHAFESGGQITIKTEQIEKKKSKYIQTTITDNGPGIDGNPFVVFEPFYTTKSTGSGLGMAISKRIIENHSGWVQIESDKGKGTTVFFGIPYLMSIEDKN
jgi:signal transduction histidine kinase